MNRDKITLVGAGLVGALLATLLAQRGFSVEVFERRPDPRKAGFLGGRSINLALAERGWHGLRVAGLQQRMQPIAVMMRGRMVHHLDGHTELLRYGRDDSEVIWSVNRGSLNMTLLDAAEAAGARIHFDQRLAAVDWDRSALQFCDEAGVIARTQRVGRHRRRRRRLGVARGDGAAHRSRRALRAARSWLQGAGDSRQQPPPPRAGEGWGGGKPAADFRRLDNRFAPIPTFPRKRGKESQRRVFAVSPQPSALALRHGTQRAAYLAARQLHVHRAAECRGQFYRHVVPGRIAPKAMRRASPISTRRKRCAIFSHAISPTPCR